jgi:hypothetical protein
MLKGSVSYELKTSPVNLATSIQFQPPEEAKTALGINAPINKRAKETIQIMLFCIIAPNTCSISRK